MTVREGCGGIYNGAVEGQSLAFVDGDGPGELQGVLAEGAGGRFLDGLGLGVEGIFRIGPGLALDEDFRAVGVDDGQAVGRNRGDVPDFAVVVTPFARRVVFDEHDLGTLFEDEVFLGREIIGREVALDAGVEGESPCR